MQFSKISGATAALLISMISASPIALTSDFIHLSGSVHVKPTSTIDHTFKIHPTGSFNPKEPIFTCTDEEKSEFTTHPTGGKFEPHHYRPSDTDIESHNGPKSTGHVSKSHKSGHAKPTGDVSKRAFESDIVEGTTVSKSHKAKPTGSAAHEHESEHAKPTGSGKKEHHHPSGTDVYNGKTPHESGHAKPTGTKEHKSHESSHAKPTGKGGKEHESGHIKPTGTGAKEHTHVHESDHAKPTGHKESARAFESGHAKPTGTGHAHESGHLKPTVTGAEHGNARPSGVHSQKPVFTGTHESKSFEFKTETLTFGTKTFSITGVVPEETGKSHTFEEYEN